MTRNAQLGYVPPYGRDALENHASKRHQCDRRAVAEKIKQQVAGVELPAGDEELVRLVKQRCKDADADGRQDARAPRGLPHHSANARATGAPKARNSAAWAHLRTLPMASIASMSPAAPSPAADAPEDAPGAPAPTASAGRNTIASLTDVDSVIVSPGLCSVRTKIAMRTAAAAATATQNVILRITMPTGDSSLHIKRRSRPPRMRSAATVARIDALNGKGNPD